MWTLFAPVNLASQVFSPLPDRPDFAAATSDLRVLDDAGHLVPAVVVPAARLLQGSHPGCGHRVPARGTTSLAFDHSIYSWVLTVQLDDTAEENGTLAVALDDGEPADVPVTRGAHSVFMRLTGPASSLRVTGPSPGLEVCEADGVLGQLSTS